MADVVRSESGGSRYVRGQLRRLAGLAIAIVCGSAAAGVLLDVLPAPLALPLGLTAYLGLPVLLFWFSVGVGVTAFRYSASACHLWRAPIPIAVGVVVGTGSALVAYVSVLEVAVRFGEIVWGV